MNDFTCAVWPTQLAYRGRGSDFAEVWLNLDKTACMVQLTARGYTTIVAYEFVRADGWQLASKKFGGIPHWDLLCRQADAALRAEFDELAAQALAIARTLIRPFTFDHCHRHEVTGFDAQGRLTVMPTVYFEPWVRQYLKTAVRRPNMFVGWPELMAALRVLPQPIAEVVAAEIVFFAAPSHYARAVNEMRAAGLTVSTSAEPNKMTPPGAPLDRTFTVLGKSYVFMHSGFVRADKYAHGRFDCREVKIYTADEFIKKYT